MSDADAATTERPSAGASLRAEAARSGGVVFSVILLLAGVFVIALFNLQSEKLFTLSASIGAASAEDLVAFWRAGAMTLAGDASGAYDPATFQSALTPPNENLLWHYPPHFFLLTAPLAFLPYGVAKALWIAASAGALLAAARLAKTSAFLSAAILFSPALFASLLVLQTGPFIALGLAAALLLAKRRPLLAGFILALLTMKPQYGLLAPIFLAARGDWRAFGAAAAFSFLLAALSAALFGLDPWRNFFTHAAGPMIEHGSSGYRDSIAMLQTMVKLGAPAPFPALAQAAALLLAGFGVFAVARRAGRKAAVGATLLLTAFASPSLWVYDWAIPAVGLLLLAASVPSWPAGLQFVAGALWIAPLLPLGFATHESSIPPAVMLALAALCFAALLTARNASPAARAGPVSALFRAAR